MDNELSLKIEFSRTLSEQDQNDFWNLLVAELEKLDLKVRGGHDSYFLDWIIDCSNSSVDKGEIVDHIGDFLLSKDDIILNFRIE